MSFNLVRNNNIYLLRGRTKSPYHPIERTITKTGKTYRLRKTERGLLEIEQPIGFKAKTDLSQIEIVDSLTNWLITDDWALLQFDDEPGRRYEALLQSNMADFEKIAWLRRGTLQFIAKSTLGKSKQINVTTTSKKHQITGQTETPWTVEVSFKANTNKFELWAGDIYLLLNYSFIAGDKLVVNYVGREVFLNGNDLRKAVSMSSHFKELKPGTVEVKASVPCTIKYDERYY